MGPSRERDPDAAGDLHRPCACANRLPQGVDRPTRQAGNPSPAPDPGPSGPVQRAPPSVLVSVWRPKKASTQIKLDYIIIMGGNKQSLSYNGEEHQK
jgi:hypothetical protein